MLLWLGWFSWIVVSTPKVVDAVTTTRTTNTGIGGRLPKQASSDTPWEELKSILSSPDILIPFATTTWEEQCLDPFLDASTLSVQELTNYVLNGDMAASTSTTPSTASIENGGFCADFLSCAYEDCHWPFFEVDEGHGNKAAVVERSSTTNTTTTSSDYHHDLTNNEYLDPLTFDKGNLHTEWLDLPAMVVQPKSVSDIVYSVQFATKYDIGITVKVAGHSFMGSSNEKNTLLIKMNNPYFPIYSTESTSLVECSDNTNEVTTTIAAADTVPTANDMACQLARARNKPAILRVGGGDLWDHAYRAVFFNWNSNQPSPDRHYHIVGGASGTVSAAGGWLASGGLSGTTGMRLYGYGVDQVLHVEMVLPSGTHVRFGPSEWTQPQPNNDEEDQVVPQTTKVTGYCNSNPHEVDETLWNWTTDCNDEEINFDDLWFAVRGGGGGTYGIITSVYYQLHHTPGRLSAVTINPPPSDVAETDWTEEKRFVVVEVYIEFILTYLYQPSLFNVTELDSHGCSSSKIAYANPLYTQGFFLCYGPTSATSMVQAWQEYLQSDRITMKLINDGQFAMDDIQTTLTGIVSVFPIDFANYGEVLPLFVQTPNVPVGRLADAPPALLVPHEEAYRFEIITDSHNTHFPIDTLRNNMDQFVPLLAQDALEHPADSNIYTTGGIIPHVDDGTTSVSPMRRHSAFLKVIIDDNLRSELYKIIFGNQESDIFTTDDDDDDDDDTKSFPGSSCHNHAFVYEMGPLKDDWTMACPSDWTQVERVERCISRLEAFWGTRNMKRLQQIKQTVDPNSLFICTNGIGYEKNPNGDAATTTPDEEIPIVTEPTSPPTTSSSSTIDSEAYHLLHYRRDMSHIMFVATSLIMMTLWFVI